MDQFADWGDMPSSSQFLKNDEFDQYLQGYDNEIDDLLNQTLLGIQDLDVPTGFANDIHQQQTQMQHQNQQQVAIPQHTTSNSLNYHQAKHSRKISGTAIFGFDNHTRELSFDKSISPGQLMKMQKQQKQQQQLESLPLKKPIPQKPITILSEEEEYSKQKTPKKADDFVVSTSNPKSYKFPPSPTPSVTRENHPPQAAHYSARYLQELNRLENGGKPQNYVDDIEPLLNSDQASSSRMAQASSTPFQTDQIKYVPIPIQEPDIHQKKSPQQQVQQQVQGQGQPFNNNTFLPPPSPPTLSQGSPEQSSPEPDPFTRESSPNLNSSPINHIPEDRQLDQQNGLFYNPQFFSDSGNFLGQNYSSPINSQSVNSSPVKNASNYFSSPLRHVPLTNDDTVDANDTIPQMTPLKSSHPPMTPSKNKVLLEWSPIVSPNAENNKNVAKAIKQGSPRRRIKKTSLLPPGELDRYWEGPDENNFFVCHYKNCGKKFTRRYNVRSHIQTHLSDRPFACAYCPKKFVRQHDLNRHVKGHLEARHCKCPCGKEFTRIDALRKHRLRNICSGGVPPEQADSLKDTSPSKTDHSSPTKTDYSSPERADCDYEYGNSNANNVNFATSMPQSMNLQQSQIPEAIISNNLLQNIDEVSPFK